MATNAIGRGQITIAAIKDGANYSPNMLKDTKTAPVSWSSDRPANSKRTVATNADGFAEFTQELLATGNHNAYTWVQSFLPGIPHEVFKPGKTYTLSFEYKSDAEIQVSFDIRPIGTNKALFVSPISYFPASSEWTRSHITAVMPANNTNDQNQALLAAAIADGNGAVGDKAVFRKFCLVEGTATEWVPAASEMVGTSAKVVVVNSEATAFIYKDDFKTLVGPQSIKLTASLQGTSGYQWSYKTPSMTSFANIAGGTSATYVLSNSFFTEKSCTLRCTSGGVHDEVTIVKVSSGSNGANYTDNLLIGSSKFKATNYVATGITSSIGAEGELDITAAAGNSNYVTGFWQSINAAEIEQNFAEGDLFTISFTIKSSDSNGRVPTIYIKTGMGYFTQQGSISSEYSTIYYTGIWKKANSINVHLGFAQCVGTYHIKNWKIEKGSNPAPQWTPHPSEMVGHDAYTVLLSNESHIFEGDTTKAVAASTSSEVIAYKGATLAAATIGTITGAPTGMTATVQNNGTTSAKFTVAVTTALTTRQGVLTVPVTVDGKAFTQKFSWSLSLKGKDGRNGSDVYSLDLDNEVAGVACNASGAVTGSYPKVTAKVYQGSQPASGVSFSLPTKTGISTATITSAGVVTMSGMTADTAEITVQAVVGGVTLQKIFSLYKVKPGSDGLSYAVNLLKKSNVVQQTVGYVLGSYEWDEHPAVGTDCTLTICGKVGPKDNYIELYQNKGYHKIGNFEGRTETVKSFKFKVTEVAGRTTLVDFYRNPNDSDFDSGTYIKWAVITLGDAPQTCWTPAKSEMEGARVFSLLTSTDNVRRNAMGELSATKVSATKYVTTGDGTTTATEHYLYYRRETASGFSAWTLGAGVGSPTTPLIDILDDTRAVVFELRDSSGKVLDHESILVISDAADMKVGGTNLLRNSDFIDGLKYWDNNLAAGLNAVTIPERNAAIGWYDNRFSAKVSHLENSQTWRKLLQPIEKGRIVPGKTYTLSGFVYIPDKSAMGAAANGSTAYRLRASMCYKLKNDTSNHDDSVIDLMQATEGEWSYMRGRWTAPANMNIEEKVEMTFYLVANGEYYVNGWKLEEGNVPTAWSAAPEDTSYLRSALRENTSIEGGLVAATMLNLGITEENGEFRVTAGMNGSTKVRGDRSIAFWAGGDAIDAEKPDDGTPAKIVIRLDGTAYFCDNTVRLDANRMEIGEEGSNKLVVLDEDGLKLIDGNEQRLRVVHQSVGTLASAADSNAVTLNTTNGIRVRRTRNKEVTTISNSGTTRVVGSFTKNFNIGSSNLPVGATVNITASIYSEFPLINDDMEGFPLLGANARLQIYERQSGTIIFDKKAPLGYDGDQWKDHWAKISANVTIPKAGEYRGNLILEGDGTEGPTNEMTVATATAKVEGSVQFGFSNQTVLGNDGLLSKWNETAWLVRSGEVHAKVGTTEFVVLPNGIKAIVGGRTIWLAQ